MLSTTDGKKKKPQSSGRINRGSAFPETGAQVERAHRGRPARVDQELQHVSQEILRLVDAAREGRLEERGPGNARDLLSKVHGETGAGNYSQVLVQKSAHTTLLNGRSKDCQSRRQPGAIAP